MNLLDVLVIAAVVLAALGGYRLGLVARGLSWIGLVLGLFLSAWTVPLALGLVPAQDPIARLLVGLITLALTVAAVTSVGEAVGLRLRGAIDRTAMAPLDRAGGFLAGAIGILFLVWLTLPAIADVPGGIARQVRASTVVAWLRATTPEPPDTVHALRRLVDQSRFPDVFADLQPAPDTGPPPSEVPVPPEVVERITASTGNVESRGCGVLYEGSAFVVGPGLMMTNAHVVAGAEAIGVRVPGLGSVEATVVVFDKDRDLALLEVAGLDRPALPLTAAEEDSPAVVVGYPGGQDQPRAAPATVQQTRTAVGRDIYDRERTEREVLFLAADLRRGDSGSPVANVDGAVVGVVFAVSPDRETTAFAVTDDEIRAVLGAPRDPGNAGSCQ